MEGRMVRSLISLGFTISIFLAVLTVGLRASPADLDYVSSTPSRYTRALLTMNVLMPIIALLICRLFSLHPAMIIALVTFSIAPVSAFFAKTLLPLTAPRTAAYASGVFFSSTVVSVLLTPLAVEAIQLFVGGDVHVNPLSVAEVAIGSVLLPLALGLGIGRWWPKSKRMIAPLEKVSSILLVLCAVPLVIAAWPLMASLWREGTVAAIVLFTLLGLAIGHVLGGPDEDNRTVLAFATVSRHPGIAIVVANLTEQALAPIGVLLAVLVSVVTVVPYKLWRKRLRTAVAAAEHHPPTAAHRH
jgi:BASS family bile acid:Na+ symporter